MIQMAVKNSTHNYLLNVCYIFKTVLCPLGNKNVISPLKNTIVEGENAKEGQTLAKMPTKESFFSFSRQNSNFVWAVMCPASSDESSKPIMASFFSFPRHSFS